MVVDHAVDGLLAGKRGISRPNWNRNGLPRRLSFAP